MHDVLAGEEASLEKGDGSAVPLKVQFGAGSAITFDVATPIEPGDILVRHLPNRAVERFEVLEPGYHQALAGIPATYQCKVRRLTSESPSKISEVATSGVFVVHGRDHAVRDDLFAFLRVIGLKVLLFDDVRGPGSESNFTIVRRGIESAQGVIVLFTPEESSALRENLRNPDDPAEPVWQPRPNVIFEAGWALGAHTEKTIIVEAGLTHAVSDIDGFNTVRMSGASSLNDLASRLGRLQLDVNRNDPAWMDATKYPSLFGAHLTAQKPVEPATASLSGLDDRTLVQLLADKLPEPGFYLFDRLDSMWKTEPGTARRLARTAAEQENRFEDLTDQGIRFGPLAIQLTRRRRR